MYTWCEDILEEENEKRGKIVISEQDLPHCVEEQQNVWLLSWTLCVNRNEICTHCALLCCMPIVGVHFGRIVRQRGNSLMHSQGLYSVSTWKGCVH